MVVLWWLLVGSGGSRGGSVVWFRRYHGRNYGLRADVKSLGGLELIKRGTSVVCGFLNEPFLF